MTIACLSVAAAAVVSSRPTTEVMAAESGTPPPAAMGEEDGGGDNASLVEAAHDLRRALIPPQQSLFRVVCILVYEDFSGGLHRITGKYLPVYLLEFGSDRPATCFCALASRECCADIAGDGRSRAVYMMMRRKCVVFDRRFMHCCIAPPTFIRHMRTPRKQQSISSISSRRLSAFTPTHRANLNLMSGHQHSYHISSTTQQARTRSRARSGPPSAPSARPCASSARRATARESPRWLSSLITLALLHPVSATPHVSPVLGC